MGIQQMSTLRFRQCHCVHKCSTIGLSSCICLQNLLSLLHSIVLIYRAFITHFVSTQVCGLQEQTRLAGGHVHAGPTDVATACPIPRSTSGSRAEERRCRPSSTSSTTNSTRWGRCNKTFFSFRARRVVITSLTRTSSSCLLLEWHVTSTFQVFGLEAGRTEHSQVVCKLTHHLLLTILFGVCFLTSGGSISKLTQPRLPQKLESSYSSPSLWKWRQLTQKLANCVNLKIFV